MRDEALRQSFLGAVRDEFHDTYGVWVEALP